MKTPLILSASLLVALTGMAGAGLPEKASGTRYTRLVSDSPFTSKPVTGPRKQVDPFEGYGLIGVSPIGENTYRVTLIHKDQPGQRITVDSGESREGLSIAGVELRSADPLATTVLMRRGTETGVVRFDRELLVLVKPAPVAKPVTSGQQPQTQAAPKPTPRPRVMPPNP